VKDNVWGEGKAHADPLWTSGGSVCAFVCGDGPLVHVSFSP
jgi:hypothetical protein